jgi:hypothetical protein
VKLGLIRDRQLDHPGPVRCIGGRTLLPRHTGRHEQNLGQPELLHRIARQLNVSDVDRVKAAPQQADRPALVRRHEAGGGAGASQSRACRN